MHQKFLHEVVTRLATYGGTDLPKHTIEDHGLITKKDTQSIDKTTKQFDL